MNLGPLKPLDGEVLPPGPTVDFWPHPLSSEGRNFLVAQPGQTLEEVFAGKLGPWCDASAVVNGDMIERPLWGQHVIAEGDVIQVRVVVRGGGGRGGSNPIAVILSIAVLVAAPYLAAAIAPSLGITTAAGIQTLSAIISVVGIVVVNALFPPRLPDTSGDGEPRPQYSISGGANRARPYEPMQLLLGKHRMFPDLAAQEYVEYDDQGDQYLNQIFEFGIGDHLTIENVRLGETPLVSNATANPALVKTIVFVTNSPTARQSRPAPSEPRNAAVSSRTTGRRAPNKGDPGSPGTTTNTVTWDEPTSWGTGGTRRYGRRLNGEVLADTTSTTWTYTGATGRPEIRAETADGASPWVLAGDKGKPSSSSGGDSKKTVPPSASPNFEGVAIQTQVPRITLVHGNVDSIAGGDFDNEDRNAANWDITRRTADDTTAIAFDIVCQHFVASNDGDLTGRDTVFDLAYKLTTSGSWTTHRVTVETQSGAEARNATRRTFRWGGLTAGAYDVRAALRTNYPEDADLSRITFKSSVPVIKAYQDDMADYTGRNPFAMRIKATGQLYGRIESLNADCCQLIEDWNGSAWGGMVATSNPASILRKWFQGFRVGGVLRAGYGLDDALIDHDSLAEWHDFCDTQGLECNVVLQDDRNEDDIARMIAQCGWARVDTSTGKYGVIWEEANRPVSAVVTPANIVAGSVSITYENENLADEIIGEFIDRDSDFQTNTLRRLVPQYTITGEFPVTIPLEGVTDGEHAAKEINRTAAAQFYHQRQITWEMSEEGFLGIGVGDVVGMAHGLVGGSKGGRLLGISSSRTVLRPAFEVSSGGTAWIWLPDGAVMSTSYTVASDGELRISTPLPRPDAAFMDDDHPTQYRVMTFQAGALYTKVRVVGMEPVGEGRFRFTARDEIDAYYDARTSDLSHPLIPYGAGARPCIFNFAMTTNPFGVRIFTWSVPKEDVEYLGVQIRYGAPGTNFNQMQDLHEGLLTESPWESIGKPGEGAWRFGAALVTADGRRGDICYIEADIGEVARGLDGFDGNGYEDIFAATEDPTVPAADRPWDTWGFDEPATAGSLTWYDGGTGTGFGEEKPYLWRCTRLVPGTPEVGANIAEAWAENYRKAGRTGTPPTGSWMDPVLIGRWAQDGEPGADGADGADGIPGLAGADGDEGQGVEYVFARTARTVTSIPSGQRPLDTWAYDTPAARGNLQWHDGAPDLTDALPKLWRSERRVPGNPSKGTAAVTSGAGAWGMWTIPTHVGSLGEGREWIFAITADANAPAAPSNSWGFDTPGVNADGTGTTSTVWFDAAPNITMAMPYLWSVSRRFFGSPAAGAAIADNWTSARIVGRFGNQGADGTPGTSGIPGADGQDGVPGNPGAAGSDGTDGNGIEYVFAVTAADVTALPESLYPDNSWGYDDPGTAGT